MLAALAAAVAWAPAPARAGQATCSNPGLPIGAAASPDLMPGRLTLNLTTSVLPVHSEQILSDAQGPLRYDTRLVLLETRLAGEYALTPWLALGGALPYRVIDVGVTTRDPTTGAPVDAMGGAIHARTETLRGLGDASVHAHLAREVGGLRLHARAGTSLPLGGHVEEDPFLLGMIGQEHQHLQLGTGTFVPFVAVEAQRPFARVTVAAWALAHLALYENDHGYRPPRRFSGGANASSSLGARAFTFSLAAEVHGETAERWNGVVYEDEGNAGRVDAMFGGGVAWRPRAGLAVVADVREPSGTRVVGSQVAYTAVAGVGIVGTFDLGRRPSWRGADHATTAPAGEAAALVPVPGRITVFDLWAAWCAPCRELDAKLAALARAHPDRLAVRKLDVVDPDSPAWRRHLAPGQFDLPHIKVFGPDGTLRFERSASPDDLIRALEALLGDGFN